VLDTEVGGAERQHHRARHQEGERTAARAVVRVWGTVQGVLDTAGRVRHTIASVLDTFAGVLRHRCKRARHRCKRVRCLVLPPRQHHRARDQKRESIAVLAVEGARDIRLRGLSSVLSGVGCSVFGCREWCVPWNRNAKAPQHVLW